MLQCNKTMQKMINFDDATKENINGTKSKLVVSS